MNWESRKAAIAALSEGEVTGLGQDWASWANDAQFWPLTDWTTWLLMGGRGAGKTRAGAEWVRARAEQGQGPIALVGESITEAIAVMVDGPSGLLAVSPSGERPRRVGMSLHWPNGTTGMILGANDPERFRGPQFASAWCDEIGKWPHAEAAWDTLQFGLRLGTRPRQVATTTPRPTRLIKRLLADPNCAVTRMGVASAGGAVNVTFNVTASDARSFAASEAELSAMLLRAVKRGTRGS